MTTKQLVALVTAFLVLGALVTYLAYGSVLATPLFH